MDKMKEVLDCPHCDGSGVVDEHITTDYQGIQHLSYKVCRKCRGDGKLDWVERVVGKSPDLSDPIYNLYEYIVNNEQNEKE